MPCRFTSDALNLLSLDQLGAYASRSRQHQLRAMEHILRRFYNQLWFFFGPLANNFRSFMRSTDGILSGSRVIAIMFPELRRATRDSDLDFYVSSRHADASIAHLKEIHGMSLMSLSILKGHSPILLQVTSRLLSLLASTTAQSVFPPNDHPV